MTTSHRPSRQAIALLIAAPFVIAACGGALAEADADDPAGATAAAPTAQVAAASPGAEDATDGSATAGWLDIELTDAESGEPFTLASLGGQIVAIEPMAIWCSNCKAQQDNVRQAYADISELGVRYISLGVDPNEDPAALARYAERRAYPWTFAQSPVEFSRALADLFGPQILSVPSTPLIVLDAQGEVVIQEFGFHGPERLLQVLGEAAA